MRKPCKGVVQEVFESGLALTGVPAKRPGTDTGGTIGMPPDALDARYGTS